MENINSVKLGNLRDDFEAQKTFFEYKAKRFDIILKKDLNSRLVGVMGRNIDLHIHMNAHFSHLYQPIIKFKIDNDSCSVDMNSKYGISGVGYVMDGSNIDSLDKIILSGFLALEIKTRGEFFKKVDKYMAILIEISHRLEKIRISINDELVRLKTEYSDRKREVIEEFIQEGSEFVVCDGSLISGKSFRSRNNVDGVLIKIGTREKKSYNIEVTGRKRTGRDYWQYNENVYAYKLGINSLIKLFNDDLVVNSNPEFERALKIHCLIN